ncbi:hypothetical protein GIB67_026771 [Kingdonia uniflora]|uniref:Inner membrane localized protein n=1 Tax=Kingdonia uniflora TaxID=39325 RepID=A0A7J7MHB7_9MAGN|nr:hypothetical protein GIB67_026771 [Kingdonia uniflora]
MLGCSLKSRDQCLTSIGRSSLTLSAVRQNKVKFSTSKRALTVQAGYSGDSGRSSSSAGIFVGGFILGGIVVGTLGCVYAPQLSKALVTDRKELMRKLPKFIYDEEKALEIESFDKRQKTRKILAAKIEQLNSAIDEVSSQLRGEDGPNGVAVSSDVSEATL